MFQNFMEEKEGGGREILPLQIRQQNALPPWIISISELTFLMKFGLCENVTLVKSSRT